MILFQAFLVAQIVKNPPATQETWVQSLGWEDPLEKGTAAHSSILAWRIPWTVKSMRFQIVRHQEQLSHLIHKVSSMHSTSCEMQGWMNQIGIKIARRNINNFRYAEDTTLMAEREEDLKNFLKKMKEESKNVGLKHNIWASLVAQW